VIVEEASCEDVTGRERGVISGRRAGEETADVDVLAIWRGEGREDLFSQHAEGHFHS